MEKLRSLLLIACVSFVLSCGEEDTFDGAWDIYSKGDYQASLLAFQALISDNRGQAYLGMAWSSLRLANIQDADDFFTIAAEDSLLGAFAGWAVVAWIKQEHESAVERATTVLDKDSRFVFVRDQRVDFRDVYWHRASSYLHQGQPFYDECLVDIQVFDPDFTTDVAAADAFETLLSKLETLRDTIAD